MLAVDQPVLRQIGHAARRAVAAQVGRRGAHHIALAADAPADQRAVGLVADADHEVEALGHRIDHALGQLQLDIQGWIAVEQRGQVRGHMAAAERGHTAHAQQALHAAVQRHHLAARVHELVQDLQRALVQQRTGLGQRQRAGRSREQRHLHLALQRVDLPGHGRGR
ncbi:hypothetical protein BV98_003213 [Sphingobium herbicidovorans NBRC 16415]|uniref:Uncharacterized protein n=1 Tax=Sphingobium herbicidovorans (strain ATCC 700291 / DSM 11019 / CCUG 56400 / KCTC 2939 / LMG 18315 / NBRC 16415 / MH) TaxID=1219045 RepID=A0A086P6J4_SPHHM|nr:hypothetical protein BV98_003213 [Sphingobium herbicidovorans NBRC 16415]